MAARHYFHQGQPLWVRLDGREVTELRLSQLWRYLGEYSAGERAGNAMPCTDPSQLCWSCRVFGSADTSGRRDDDISRQRSYRGHVRADDLLATADFEPDPWHLAPLEAPQPSAGQFYLDNIRTPSRWPPRTRGPLPPGGRARTMTGGGRSGAGSSTGARLTRTGGAHPRGQAVPPVGKATRDVVLVPAGTSVRRPGVLREPQRRGLRVAAGGPGSPAAGRRVG